MAKTRTGKTKTSINIDQGLWRLFWAKLTTEGGDYGQAIEQMVREYVKSGGKHDTLRPTEIGAVAREKRRDGDQRG